MDVLRIGALSGVIIFTILSIITERKLQLKDLSSQSVNRLNAIDRKLKILCLISIISAISAAIIGWNVSCFNNNVQDTILSVVLLLSLFSGFGAVFSGFHLCELSKEKKERKSKGSVL